MFYQPNIIVNHEAVKNEIFSTSRNLLSISVKCFSQVVHSHLLDVLLLGVCIYVCVMFSVLLITSTPKLSMLSYPYRF